MKDQISLKKRIKEMGAEELYQTAERLFVENGRETSEMFELCCINYKQITGETIFINVTTDGDNWLSSLKVNEKPKL